jgi:methionyl-tRNA synthetase
MPASLGLKPVLITATAPTPNGPLHVGHLSGPYLAADIAARAARARGHEVITVCGLDPHQNYVLAKAEALGHPVEQVLDHYEGLVRQAFASSRIDYDMFIEPRVDPGYRSGVRDLVAELVASKAAVLTEVTLSRCDSCGRTLHHAYVTGACPLCGTGSGGGTCEGCGLFTTAANLQDARCASCGGRPQPASAEIPVLQLEDWRDRLAGIWARAVIPPRVRELIDHYLSTGLPDVPLAYPTDWGIPFGRDGSQHVDVWVEMGLGYLREIGRRFDPTAQRADELVRAWGELGQMWHFLGIDNAFYYAVLFPALLAAAGLPDGKLGGLVVNEFYRLDGAKFSTSRNHAIWAHEMLAGEDPGTVRLYLCWDRPDPLESDFTAEAYQRFRDWWSEVRQREHASLPAPLAQQNVERAERSLDLAHFDPAMAVRCLLPAYGSDDGRAGSLLRLLSADPPPTEDGRDPAAYSAS